VCFSKLGEKTQLSVSKHKLTTSFLQIEAGGGEEMGELGSSQTIGQQQHQSSSQ
jgi:hypothetical protein